MADGQDGMNGAKTGQQEPVFAVNTSRGFTSWLAEQKVSLAFTTYQVGKLFMIGLKPDGKLWVHNRNIGRCLGLVAHGADLWVTADTQVFRLRNAMLPGKRRRMARMRCSCRRYLPSRATSMCMISRSVPTVRSSSPIRCSTAWRG